MLKNSRVSKSIDTARLGAAVRGPGMDTRTWVSLAVVTAVHVDPAEGVFVDVTLMPLGDQSAARLGVEYAGNGFGMYAPLEVDDEVLVEAPSGDPDAGLIVTRRLHGASDPPPQEVVDHPEDLLVVVKPGKTLRMITKGAGNLVIEAQGSGGVRLGAESASESVIKGTTYRLAEDAFFTAITTFAATCTTTPPGTPAAALTAALTAFTSAVASALSQKVRTT